MTDCGRLARPAEASWLWVFGFSNNLTKLRLMRPCAALDAGQGVGGRCSQLESLGSPSKLTPESVRGDPFFRFLGEDSGDCFRKHITI